MDSETCISTVRMNEAQNTKRRNTTKHASGDGYGQGATREKQGSNQRECPRRARDTIRRVKRET